MSESTWVEMVENHMGGMGDIVGIKSGPWKHIWTTKNHIPTIFPVGPLRARYESPTRPLSRCYDQVHTVGYGRESHGRDGRHRWNQFRPLDTYLGPQKSNFMLYT